jgi:hypothetical protein
MPDNSSDYMSKFAPKSHFFTDPLLITQSLAQAFGPVSNSIFRLTTKFTVAAGGSTAFAICSGVVLLQPQQGNSGKVNLILRPFKQPIQGINIKYFVYRGLNAADFFNGNNIIFGGANTSDYINSVNASFKAFYTSQDAQATLPVFDSSFIGYNPSKQADTLLIDDLFFKQSTYTVTAGTSLEDDTTAFELPMLPMGASLGSFTAGECGLDIVISYGDYSLTAADQFVFNLAYARATEATIDISTETDTFKQKLAKEQICQFLDAAAYYGFHAIDTGSVLVKSGTTKVIKKGTAIYTDVINNFTTKNNIYLYIQSDRTRSYNFYGNYFIDGKGTNTNCLKIGQSETSLSPADYNTNGWPLLIDNTTQTNTTGKNTLCLQLVTDNNVNTMLYGQVAQIENAEANNFCSADDLTLPNAADGTPSAFTKIITLSNPATGADNAKLNVASFNILIYQGQTYYYVAGQVTDENNVTTNILAQPNFFDDVFGDLNATPLLKAGNNTYTNVASQKVKLINNYYNDTQYGISAVQTTVINDQIDTGDSIAPTLSRVIYISDSVGILNEATSISGTITSDMKSTLFKTNNPSFQLQLPFYFSITNFTDDNFIINGLDLRSTDGTISSKIILGLIKAENDSLLTLISMDKLTNTRLFLVNLSGSKEQLVSLENVVFQKFKIGIVGEDNSGTLQLNMPGVDVNVYSLDQKYYYSKGFSEHMEFDGSISNVVLDLDISL